MQEDSRIQGMLGQSMGGKQAQGRVGDLLVRAGLVSMEVLNDANRQAGGNAARVGEILVAMNQINKTQLDMATQAQELIKDGALDLYTAVRAISKASRQGMTFSDALSRAGYKGPAAARKDRMTSQLGELLVNAGILSQDQIEKAQQKSLSTGLPVGRTLVLSGVVTETFLDAALNAQMLIREGKVGHDIAIKALNIAYKRQVSVPKAKRDAETTNLRVGDLVISAGIATEFDVRAAVEMALDQYKDEGTMLVQNGLISEETLSCAVELVDLIRQRRCTPPDAWMELREVHDNFPVNEAGKRAAKAPPPAPEPPAPVEQPVVPQGPTQTSFGNVIMPGQEQRVIQLGGAPIIMPDQGSQRVIQLGGAPSGPPGEAAPAAQAPATQEKQNLMADLDSALARSQSQAAAGYEQPPVPGQSQANRLQQQQQAAASDSGSFSQLRTAPVTPLPPPIAPGLPGSKYQTANAAVADALSQMFNGLDINEQQLQAMEENWRKEDEERKRFQEEVRNAAKATDELAAGANAGIRSQEAEAAAQELDNELSAAPLRQKRKKQIIIGGIVAGVVVSFAGIWAITHPSAPSIEDEIAAARKHLKEGKLESARQEIKLAISKQPNNPEALLILGEALFKSGDYHESLKQLKEAETQGAKLTNDHLQMMAESSIKEKRWNQARTLTQKLIDAAPSPQLYKQLSRIERESGNIVFAVDALNKAISAGDTSAYAERGELYVNMKQPRQALADFDEAIKLNDEDKQSHFLRGRVHLQLGDATSALSDFAKAASPDKPDAKVLSYQAVAYNKIGDHQKALDTATQALQIDRNSIPALLARGDSFMARGAYRRAENDYDSVLLIDKDNDEAREKKHDAYVAAVRSGAAEENAPKEEPAPDGKSDPAAKPDGKPEPGAKPAD